MNIKVLIQTGCLMHGSVSSANISDQASYYEKYGSSVSSSLWDTLDGQGN